MHVSEERSSERVASGQFDKCFLRRERPSDFCRSAAARYELVDVRFSLLLLIIKIADARRTISVMIRVLVIRLSFSVPWGDHTFGNEAIARRLVASSTCV